MKDIPTLANPTISQSARMRRLGDKVLGPEMGLDNGGAMTHSIRFAQTRPIVFVANQPRWSQRDINSHKRLLVFSMSTLPCGFSADVQEEVILKFTKPMKRVLHRKPFAIAVIVVSSAFSLLAQRPMSPLVAVTSPRHGTWGFDPRGMDPSVKPGDDFFSYANGAWIRKTNIPPDQTSVGPFSDLRRLCAEQVHLLLETTQDNRSDSDEGRVHTLYQAFMDDSSIEQAGAHPLQSDLQLVRKVGNRADVARLMKRHGFEASLFDLEIEKDEKHPDRYAVHLGQGDLGLPNRDLYLDAQFTDKKRLYKAYVAEMLRLAKWPNANKSATAVVAFESLIAQASWRGEDLRDNSKSYHSMSLANLRRMAPMFPWADFMAGDHLSENDFLIVTTDTSVVKLAELYGSTPLSTLKAWEAFRMTDAAAPYLSNDFRQARFAFRGNALNGLEAPPSERWPGAVSLLNALMGSTVGKMYVAAYFPAERKMAVQAIADSVMQALRSDLAQLTWMDPITRAKSLRKLDDIAVQMGYPDHWRSYAGVNLNKQTLYKDVETLRNHNWNYQVSQLKMAWNKNDWRFWPQEPVAYTENGQLIFPAGMLQAPFFTAQADAAVNYGSIGHVIGHELTHPFDDRGDWWTPEDRQRFKERSARLAKQYSAMEPLPGVHIKGELTLIENVADLGGLSLAYKAYRTTLSHDEDAVERDFTRDQEFFLGYAQVCREKERPDSLRNRLASEVHSPAAARLNGVVQNMPEWYKAFNVNPGERMYIVPDERVAIW
ncbi:M13 family metallopeptidase [Granulicella tundricola]|uniref:Endothelin-converting enzyme 1 n=1 Tax=Granulicella tundricola (strain ATCC BAA-1859 / DSM 23138 / MP5ACTX9) TaxID=1198114 RepID=E8X7I6_GRATM|nr:M13 family metallopeptidase [Granulicella tundricola]ADW71420.1 Endothelin-converting enzyme 1 [Granulicella tundricola MP5ACTX9]